MSSANKPVLVIAGPTASGKTAAALALAQRIPIEIISMDSALVYRGMDIGTAKPSAAERASVPHHLIDIIEPTDSYSAACFAVDAGRCIDAITARGATPVIVGGTLLYLKALSEGLDPMPGADLAVRATLNEEAALHGWPALHAELLALDPLTAARLNPNDAQRISRALEVLRSTGVPLSAYHGNARPAGMSIKLISLEPQDRSVLHERINSRFVAMLDAGLLQEVAQLRQLAGINANLPSMRCVGYRQAWEHQDGLYGLDELIARGQAASRQLAKRQLTWLRGMPGRVVIACDNLNSVAEKLLESLSL